MDSTRSRPAGQDHIVLRIEKFRLYVLHACHGVAHFWLWL
jgi:hypothetical protein